MGLFDWFWKLDMPEHDDAYMKKIAKALNNPENASMRIIVTPRGYRLWRDPAEIRRSKSFKDICKRVEEIEKISKKHEKEG